MFYICIFWTSSSIFASVYTFPYEKTYLVKERKADMYRLSVYYVCSTLCDMLAHICYSTIFMLIIYFMADLKRTTPCLFLTLLAMLLIVVTGQVSFNILIQLGYHPIWWISWNEFSTESNMILCALSRVQESF